MGITDWFAHDLNTEERTLTLDVSPVLFLSFILDEIKDGKFNTDEGVNILDIFVKHYVAVGI